MCRMYLTVYPSSCTFSLHFNLYNQTLVLAVSEGLPRHVSCYVFILRFTLIVLSPGRRWFGHLTERHRRYHAKTRQRQQITWRNENRRHWLLPWLTDTLCGLIPRTRITGPDDHAPKFTTTTWHLWLFLSGGLANNGYFRSCWHRHWRNGASDLISYIFLLRMVRYLQLILI